MIENIPDYYPMSTSEKVQRRRDYLFSESKIAKPSIYLATNEPPGREFLFYRSAGKQSPNEGGIPSGKVVLLVGAGAAGKSTLALQMAVSVALGEPLLGRLFPKGPGRVLVIFCNDEKIDTDRRLHFATKDRNEEEIKRLRENLFLYSLAGEDLRFEDENYKESETFRALLAKIEETKPSLVILDPLSRFAHADSEKDSSSATLLGRRLEILAHTGATILCTHHTTKAARANKESDETIARGSSALTDAAALVMTLTDGNYYGSGSDKIIKLAFPKNNCAPFTPMINLVRDGNGLLRTENSNEKRKRDGKVWGLR